jgi:hypothetical protein
LGDQTCKSVHSQFPGSIAFGLKELARLLSLSPQMPMLIVNALWHYGVKVNGFQQLKVVALHINLKKVQRSMDNLLNHCRITVNLYQILKQAHTWMMHYPELVP